MQQNENYSNKMIRNSAFTLIEIIAVCAIIGILFAISVPGIQLQIWEGKKKSETDQLESIAHIIQSSFESTDLEGTNIAAFPNCIPLGTAATQFSTSTDVTLLPNMASTNDWYVKVARQAGYNPQIGAAPTHALQPQIANILINSSQNTRIMLSGPNNESNQQRFIILSLISPRGQLEIPALPDINNTQVYLNYFNDLWNTDWNYPSATLPSSWTASLTSSQISAWQHNSQLGSNLSLLRVQRIVCPKYAITVNNTHPSDNCYIYFNFNGSNASSTSIVNSNSGPYIISSILAGRQIQAYRGNAIPPNANLFTQFILRDNCEITLQD